MSKSNFSHTSMGSIFEVSRPENPGLPGNRNDESLKSAYPTSPTYNPSGDEEVRKRFEDLCLQGSLTGEGLKGSGFGLPSYNRDFVDAPSLSAVEKDNSGNDVASPFVPNVAAPNAAGEQENVTIPVRPAGGDFVGDGLKSPSATSKDIGLLKIGSYGLGASSPQS
jgi:hypothetical protein